MSGRVPADLPWLEPAFTVGDVAVCRFTESPPPPEL